LAIMGKEACGQAGVTAPSSADAATAGAKQLRERDRVTATVNSLARRCVMCGALAGSARADLSCGFLAQQGATARATARAVRYRQIVMRRRS
jgi:hypothetical protein